MPELNQKRSMPADAVVGKQIRSRRKQLKISQEKLGKSIGVSFQQVQKYENGTNRVGAGRLSEIGKVLDVPIAYFFPEGRGKLDLGDDVPLFTGEEKRLLRAFKTIADMRLRAKAVEIVEAMGTPVN